MIRFIVERVVQLVIVVFLMSTFTFLLLRLAPGDPARIMLTAHNVPASQEALDSVREELGLTNTLPVQYVHWIKDVFTGQWGVSYMSKQPVLEEIVRRIPATFELALGGLGVMLFMTFLLGMSTALRSQGIVNRFGEGLALVGSSLPSFWLGFLLIYIYSVKYQLLPSMGRGSLENLVLPAITLGFGLGTVYARVFREHLLDVLQKPFVKAARARGQSEFSLLIGEVLKHAILPMITMTGTSFAFMLGGSIIVETVFSWPGLGRYIIDAINMRDYPIIQGYVIFTTFLFVLIHILIDILCSFVDPRLRAN
ncbi:nickel ABC transporter permease [Priestia endophytica]|uniref:nickel ABC transporter permease n=1 Tax=Priestia endophytica TaxID=135735 RepID=UPI002E1D5A9E|nr:nickel ABC transporter permease [Priestia endophytica]MED4069838.1 ABC transporter permease [Priestia endophytica]